MLTVPSELTDAHRTVFYRLVAVDTGLRYRAADERSAAARSTSLGS